MRGLLSIFLVLTVFAGFSQKVISGRVVDASSGEGLLGAHVYLLSDWRKGSITELEGYFRIDVEKIDPADSLIISYVGFEETMIPVSDQVLVELVETEFTGETVVVTATPLISEEFKFIRIKKLDIYTNPAAKADPILAVNSLPSATTTDESANISLRGSSPIETGIFLNNVPMYDAVRYSQLNGIGTFSIFNTAIISDLTVFPGNPPLEFGNVTSGMIAMKTDDRILEESTNSLAVSLANIGFSREQRISDRQSIKLFTNWQPSAAIKALNPESLREIESFNSNDFGVYWYGKSNKIGWKVLNYTNSEGYEFNYTHPSFSGIFDQQKLRNFLVSSIEVPLKTGAMSINNGYSLSNGEYAYSNSKFEVQKRDFFGGLNYSLTKSKFSLKSGISFDQRTAAVKGELHEVNYALGLQHPTFYLDETTRIRTIEAFTYFKYFISDAIAVGSGLRKNIPGKDSEDYLSNQINFSWKSGNLSTTLGFGNYHKRGLYENSGEAFFAESQQLSMDLKYKIPYGLITLSLFDKSGAINQNEYDAYGAEFFTDLKVSKQLKVSGSFTWLNSESEDVSNQYDLNYFIRGNAAFSPGKFWTIESILIARQGSYFSPVVGANYDNNLMVYAPFYAEDQARYPDYFNLSISVSKIFTISESKNVIAFASLNNVLDNKNVRGYSYNTDYTLANESYFSRRTGYLGFVYNF